MDLTETSPLVSVNDYKQTEFTGSVGLPAAYTEIEIRDEDGNATFRNECCWRALRQRSTGYEWILEVRSLRS